MKAHNNSHVRDGRNSNSAPGFINKTLKLLALLFLTLTISILALTMSPARVIAEATDPSLAASGDAKNGNAATIQSKDEIIYSRLDNNGNAKMIYVVNHFRVDTAGTLSDIGKYEDLRNLTTTEALTYNDNTVSVPVDKGEFYYQGSLLDSKLPWIFDISYQLNGKKVDMNDLPDCSGKLQIKINCTKNDQVNSLFFDNYTLQIQLNLKNSLAQNIVAKDATFAVAGAATQLVFSVLPGKDASFTISADVTDFEMDAIQITALPFSMTFDLPDTSKLNEDLSDLSDAIAQLNSGTNELSYAMGLTSDGATKLADGSAQFRDGLQQLVSNTTTLVSASADINTALNAINSQLSEADIDTSQLSDLTDALNLLALTLNNQDQTQPGISQVLDNVILGLDASLGATIPPLPTSVEADIAALGALALDEQFSALIAGGNTNALNAVAAIQNIVNNYPQYFNDSQVWMNTAQISYLSGGGTQSSPSIRSTLQAVSTGSKTVAEQLQLIATSLGESLNDLSGLNKLTAGLTELATNYTSFNQGLIQYADGVNTLNDYYIKLDASVALLAGGLGTVNSNLLTLSSGTAELHTKTSDMPAQFDSQIDEFLSTYKSSDFTPTSFVDQKNDKIGIVQFILMTEPIKIAETPATTEEDLQESFLDRLLSLFGVS